MGGEAYSGGMKKYAVEITLLSIAVLCILLLGVVKLSGDGEGSNPPGDEKRDAGEWADEGEVNSGWTETEEGVSTNRPFGDR